ncbi:MAG: tetratricopeptide repeat protein [Desulfobacteraceae bacterium]|nr:tetratricopeptide repeat protein [Desulfobacteraceae bacterium]
MSMNKAPSLNPDGEQAWLRLKLHLEWCDHFALVFIFTAHPGVVNCFRERLANIYRARVTRLVITDPDTPEDLFNTLLPKLLHPPVHQQCLKKPYWIDLSGKRGEGWTKARLSFLTRLNEQREPLRKALNSPLVLVLPLEERPRIKQLIPDLWAIRDFSMETGSWSSLEGDHSQAPAKEPVKVHTLSPFDTSLVQEWERLKKKNTLDRGFFLAAQRALDVCLSSGQHRLAVRIAESQRESAKNRLQQTGETRESLRDLSVSLNNVGNTAKALGEWEKAQALFEESLEIRRRILGQIGETPESLRDLSVSLDNVGNTAEALGEWEKAQALFEESLEISRRILGQIGETPESLRDLSVSLENVGKVAKELGQLEKARAFFEEGVSIARILHGLLPLHADYKDLEAHFKSRLEDVA